MTEMLTHTCVIDEVAYQAPGSQLDCRQARCGLRVSRARAIADVHSLDYIDATIEKHRRAMQEAMRRMDDWEFYREAKIRKEATS